MAAASKARIDWTTPYLDSFRGVERAIRLSRGFILLPVEAVGPDLGRALGEWLTTQGHPAVIIEPRDDKEWEEIAGTLYETKVDPEGVVLVLGRRLITKGFYEGVWLLNQKRDPIIRVLAQPLLWCGSREMLSAMWERAPDFWSIRAVERQLEATQGKGLERAPKSSRAKGPEYDLSLDPNIETLSSSSAQSFHDSYETLDLARRFARANELTEADKLLHQAITMRPQRWNGASVIEAWLLQASVTRRQGRLAVARAYLDRAEFLMSARTSTFWSHRWEARLLLERGRLALAEGNPKEASGAIEQAVEISSRFDDQSFATEAQITLATLYLETHESWGAVRALAILDQIQNGPTHFASQGGPAADADSEVDILTTRARALTAAGSSGEAMSALDSATSRAFQMLPRRGHAAALLVRIVHTAIEIGASSVAEHLAREALDMARTAGDKYAERNAAEALDQARASAS